MGEGHSSPEDSPKDQAYFDKEFEKIAERDPDRLEPILFPREFDHLRNPQYVSSTDKLLERMARHGKKGLTSSSLTALANAEREEILGQQRDFEASHPAWGQQKAITEAAVEAFHASENPNDNPIHIYVDNDGNIQDKPFENSENSQYRKFTKHNIHWDYYDAHYFEEQTRYFENLASTAAEITDGFVIQKDAQKHLGQYVEAKINRFFKKLKKTQPNSEEHQQYEEVFRQLNELHRQISLYRFVFDKEHVEGLKKVEGKVVTKNGDLLPEEDKYVVELDEIGFNVLHDMHGKSKGEPRISYNDRQRQHPPERKPEKNEE